jgi:hypothetical protein
MRITKYIGHGTIQAVDEFWKRWDADTHLRGSAAGRSEGLPDETTARWDFSDKPHSQPIKTLEMLRGRRSVRLVINRTPIVDLMPLKEVPLKILYAQ